MDKKEPLPIDNTGTGKLGSIRVTVKKTKECPRCKRMYRGFSALSRRDNKTDICSNCGSVEAMEDFYKERWTDKIYWEVK